jgi:transcription elongation factor Elf1
MQLGKMLEEIEQNRESNLKKRFACSHCGKTWVEIIGLFAGTLDDQEDIFVQIGKESEVCKNCKFNLRSCPACGSKDTYEINFPATECPNSPLGFERILIISKTNET